MQCSNGGLIALAGSVLTGSGLLAHGGKTSMPSELHAYAIFGGLILLLIGLAWAFSERIRGPSQR